MFHSFLGFRDSSAVFQYIRLNRQSAANTSDVYSISSLIFLIVALVFLVSWLYYCEKEKS